MSAAADLVRMVSFLCFPIAGEVPDAPWHCEFQRSTEMPQERCEIIVGFLRRVTVQTEPVAWTAYCAVTLPSGLRHTPRPRPINPGNKLP